MTVIIVYAGNHGQKRFSGVQRIVRETERVPATREMTAGVITLYYEDAVDCFYREWEKDVVRLEVIP